MRNGLMVSCLLVGSVLISSACRNSTVPSATPQETGAAQATATPSPTATPEAPRPSGPLEFTDITAQAGIHFKHHSGAFGKKYLPETIGPGCAFIDYDNDGWQDVVLVNSMDWPEQKKGRYTLALYHNNKDGTFTDVTAQAGLALEM